MVIETAAISLIMIVLSIIELQCKISKYLEDD